MNEKFELYTITVKYTQRRTGIPAQYTFTKKFGSRDWAKRIAGWDAAQMRWRGHQNVRTYVRRGR